MPRKYRVLACPCMGVSESESYAYLRSLLESNQSGYTVAINAEKILKYSADPAFREILENSIFPYPDGSGAVLGLRWLHAKRVKKVNMPVMALKAANEMRVPTFIIGATADNHAKAIESIKREFKHIDLVGHLDGYQDEQAMVRAVQHSRPSLVLVAMGSPKQEIFAAALLAQTGTGIVVGCGGALDIMAGAANRAPAFMINNHLEWLYRLYTEPWRIRRQVILPRFLWRLSLASARKLVRTA